ncbi:NAD(P)H-binding protein [Streptomyces sp. NPDC007971]|uniref:NAD(P)H-binding protein n=1 Tax=Streptomyces sp. NPDC007971 TaxID=3364799 RepID=UPI0036E3B4FC
MRLFVVGAKGGIGRQVVYRALLNGHRVTAFMRRSEGLPPDPRLTVVTPGRSRWSVKTTSA